MLAAILTLVFFTHTWAAEPLQCQGIPRRFEWADPYLKIDSENSVVALAHNAEGIGYGYTIERTSGPAGKLYQAMGLKQGDVIIALNGVDFDSPFKAITDLASAKVETAFCLVYERAGKKVAQSFIRFQKKK